MDDDDGLMMNFSIDASATSNKRSNGAGAGGKVKGGKWSDRRKTQLKLEGRSRGSDKQKTEREKVSDANAIPVGQKRQNPNPNPKPRPIPRPTDANALPLGQKRPRPAEGEEGEKITKTGDGGAPASSVVKKQRVKEVAGEAGGKDNTYVSSLFTATPEIQKRDYQEVEQITNESVPSNAPLSDATTFPSLGLTEVLDNHLTKFMRFSKPTRIQRSVIPNLLSKNFQNDLFIHSQTGSGKTLAFLLPLIQKLISMPKLDRKSGLYAIILTPTRELAIQIYSVLENLVRCCHRIVPGIVIGGEKKKSEKARLRKGVNVLVATPGRLLDHMDNTQTMNLSQVRYLILDEGDKLMELGFEEPITQIVENLTRSQNFELDEVLPHKRINILCSATFKPNVEKLSKIVLNEKNQLKISNEDYKDDDKDREKVPDQLVQHILVVPPKLRFVSLSGLLMKLSKSLPPATNGDNKTNTKTIVFFSCADSVDFHFLAFTREGEKVSVTKRNITEEVDDDDDEDDDEDDEDDNDDGENGGDASSKPRRDITEKQKEKRRKDNETTAMTGPLINKGTVFYKLHGSLTQHLRTTTLTNFANCEKNAVLLCTDVASRGLDLMNINNVVEFDPPFTIDDHLHRVGRTARSGANGNSYLFLLPGLEENYVSKIEKYHNKENMHFINFENLLKDAFGEEEEDDKSGKKKISGRRELNWDTHATTFQLNFERYLLEDENVKFKTAASNAFISHIRAYTTHLSIERDCFNLKAVHMGHLAKSFGLRETPKKVAVNSGGGTSTKNKKESAKNKMFRMARLAVSSSNAEFNTI